MNIALLTGRGGSVSIPDKNILPVLGRPLMAYPFLAAKHSRLIDDIYLSTDGQRLKDVARGYGMKIIDRPPELAQPTSQHVECLRHALDCFRTHNVHVHIMVVLLCNVATHRIGDIDRCITLLDRYPDASAVVTVQHLNQYSPLIAKRACPAEGRPPLNLPPGADAFYIEPSVYEHFTLPTSRHEMPPTYFLTHSIWALRVSHCFGETGQPPWAFMGNRIIGLPVGGGTDIHDREDVAYSEAWLRMHGWSETRVPLPEELI